MMLVAHGPLTGYIKLQVAHAPGMPGTFFPPSMVIGIDTNNEVVVVSLTTWEAHHSPRAKPEGCGELPRSLMRQQ